MKNNMKEKMLKNVADLGRKAAKIGYVWPSWYSIHQPETPEALKKMMEKK